MATHYPSTTSPSKQSLICRRKTRLRPDSCKKIKLLCSYGGAFLPRSFTGKLRYSGGETRIVSIHRDAGLSRLRAKLAEFRSSPSLVLKYQLPDSVIDALLVSVSTDEDFENMVDEHDKLEAEGNLGRLRLFLCEDPGYVETQVSDLCSSEFGHVTSRTGEFLSQKLSETKIQTLHQAGTGNFWYPLPDIQSAPCLNPAGGELGLVGNFRFPTISCSLSTRLTEPLVSGEGFRFANCDQSGRNRFQFQNQAQYSVQAVDAEHGLLKSRNSYIENVNRANILPWNHDPVSLAPVSCFDRSAKHFSLSKHDGFLPNAECRIENHSTISCDIQNHQNNAYDFGHCRIVGFDGRNCAGKCYPGLKPRSNISKFAHNRLHFTHLGRPWFNTPEYMREQRMAKIVEPIIRRTQPLSNHESGRRMLRSRASHQRNGRILVDHHAQLEREIGTCLDRKTNLQRDCLNYRRVPLDLSAHHGPPHHITNQSQLPSNFFDNQIPWFGDMTVRDDCSCHSERTHCKISSQAMRNNPFITPHDPVRVNLKFHDLNLEPNAKEMAKRNFVGLGYNAMFPGYNPKIQQNDMCKNSEGLQDKAVQVSSNDFVKLEASSRNFKSLMGLSVDNRSLSSNSTDASQIYDQSFALEQMNIGPTKSGMVVEKASGLGTDNRHNEQSSLRLSEWPGRSHAQVCSESKKNYTCREENKQTILCGLDAEEKDIVQGCGDGSKIDSGVNGDHKKSLTCIAMPELQTIKNSDLEEIRELGSGTYGTVFYGKWKGCDVVIKRIKSSCFSNGEVEDRLINDFWKEAHILAQLHHPSVVAFYGVVRDEQVANLATVTEYMVNGSLKQVLQRKDRTIDRRKRLIISMDVAFGMEYLHEKNIVHFDLKSANLLVNMKDPQRPVCKIGDLGLSKVKQKTLVSGGVRGTLPWIAPELLSGKSRMVSEKVDVYSFGIVLWELLTGEEPYAGMRSHEIIEGIINGSLRPEIPCWCDPIWRSLMERCWSSDPESRPAFSEIAKELRAMSVSMNIK